MRTVFVGAQENPNGVNSYTYNLALELQSRGWKSEVLSFGSSKMLSNYKGVTIRQYRTYGGTMTSIPLLYLKSLPYLIRHRKEIDMVMYQTVSFSVIPALIVRLFGVKTSSIIHSLAEDSPKHGTIMKLILISSMKLALSLIRNVITVSHTKASEVFERYRKRCLVLPCGVSLPSDDGNYANFLDKFGIRKQKYFLTIGRIDPIKNYEVLIEAFRTHPHEDFQLVVCGNMNNAYGQELMRLAKEDKNIIFTGMVSGQMKASLLRNCMAYCLVSSSEGLPIALLEGMSYGKIPIVTRIPSILEVLQKYNVGLWSDVKNVDQVKSNMLLVEHNLEALQYHGDIALKIIKDNYTWSLICDKYLEIIKEL